jgi:hypothetical protein
LWKNANPFNPHWQRHDARGDIMALADSVRIMWRRLDLDGQCRGIPRCETSLPGL